MTPIEAKLRNAAALDAGLAALLGTAPFRWFDTQETPGAAFPAVTVQEISAVPLYANTGQNPMALVRVQITIWEGQAADETDSVLNALQAFLATFSATSIPGQASNRIVNRWRRMYTETQPGVYLRMVDVMIWNNDNI